MTLLKATNLTKIFKDRQEVSVLKNVTFTLPRGTSIAIMGKSGEGKSTLLHILGTLDQPTSGTLEINGMIIDQKKSPLIRNELIGFIFQSYHLLEEETVLYNILMPAKIAKQQTRPGSKAHKRALELLAHVGLSHRKDFLAKVLSGGEKQRVAIARALCNDPQLILADEPTGNLDQIHSAAIHELLISSVKKFGKSLIIVTHDRDLATKCDEILYLKDGQLCKSSSLEQVT